ncbi:polysaccharide pyruvyl transferase family protein [Gracilibacillus alcaliphilus]|uniref:polysaccharide pyruvyl transferase family protein n=1 Tax=Gracilibacillus alcaliphilus TaxID=1401441 RepID=UPI00195EA61C|nr:polysaccharide pyruvyl transferase family protein [Gracilibacillus alcaliphilus]MBM7676258.1 polysaccharide pyruvyl transferase WcaK-like protein [Gracilibacillus alcaliphilus]
MRKVLYIGWIGYRNLGDDLLWHAFRELHARYLSSDQITVVPSFPAVNIRQLEPYDTVVLGGGSLIAPSYIAVLYKAMKMGKKILIWGSGIDRIPETQLYHLQNNEKVSTILRFQGEERDKLREVFQGAVFAGVRGPYTKRVIEILTGEQEISVIGDPGLLLEVEKNSPNRQQTIGINWGTTNNQLYGGNEKMLEDQIVSVAQQLIEDGYDMFIYAVWDQDFAACQRLVTKIDREKSVVFERKLYSEQELMTKLSECQLTINFKLHPNVLSFAAGTPAIALGYRFKVFDLYASLALAELVLTTNSKDLDQQIIELVSVTNNNREQIMSVYRAKQDLYRPKIESPFVDSTFYMNRK